MTNKMINESLCFFAFFAAVFVFCAIAEWMFAVEAVRYARRRNLGKRMRLFLSAVIISDGLSIILNVGGWCWAYTTINGGRLICSDIVAELITSAFLAPLLSPATFLGVGLAGPLVAIIDGPLLFLLPLTLPMGLLSFASPIMRTKVMWKAEWLSWIKLLFVVYAMFLPASLLIPFSNGR